MLKGGWEWLGQPGRLLALVLAFSLVGLIGTIVFAGAAAIPIIGLVALPFTPFPTAVLYLVATLMAYLAFREFLWRLPLSRTSAGWISAALATGSIVSTAICLPSTWNNSAGLTRPKPQSRPTAVAIPDGGTIALIDKGDPRYVGCNALCLSLLVQGRVKLVQMVSTLQEPSSLKALPGKSYSLNANSRDCLTGKPDYAFAQAEKDRQQEFITHNYLPVDYDGCLDKRDVMVTPSQQTTLVEWLGIDGEKGDGTEGVGFTGPIGLLRTIVPQGDGLPPVIREARYRSGYRYVTPLFLNPFAGNAGSGSYFAPSIATSYFEEPGFPDALESRFWKMLAGSEDLGITTAHWLDGIVDRRPVGAP